MTITVMTITFMTFGAGLIGCVGPCATSSCRVQHAVGFASTCWRRPLREPSRLRPRSRLPFQVMERLLDDLAAGVRRDDGCDPKLM